MTNSPSNKDIMSILYRMAKGGWGDIKGIGNIPGAIVNQIKQKDQQDESNKVNPIIAATRLSPAIDLLAKMGKGTVNSYADTLGIKAGNNAPLFDPNKSVFSPGGVNTSGISFQPGAAVNNAIDHPVNTALNLLPMMPKAAGIVKSLPKIGRAAEVAPTAEESTIIGNLGKTTKSVPPPTTPPGVRQLSAPEIPDAAAKSYMSPYTIPAKLNLKPTEIGKWMINDKPNLKKIPDFMDSIESMKLAALDRAAKQGIQVNTNPAMQNIKSIDNVPQLKQTPKVANAYKTELTKMMPSKLSNVKGNIGGADPLATYDAIHAIEHKGYQYLNSSMDTAGQVKNWDIHNIANVYIDTAKQLEMDLDKSVGKENVQAYTQSPAIQQAMNNFSPQVSARMANNVHNWSDLRGLEKPYVDMTKVLNATERSGHTAYANLSGNSSASMTGAIGAGIGATVAGVPGAVVGGIAGRIAEPYLSAVGNKYLPSITASVATAAPKIGSAISTTGNILKYGGPLAVGASQGLSSQEQSKTGFLPSAKNTPEGKNNQNDANKIHNTISVSQKLSDVNLNNPLPTLNSQTIIPGYISTQEFIDQNNKLQEAINQNPYDSTGVAAIRGQATLKANYDAGQTAKDKYIAQHKLNEDEKSFMQKAKTTDQIMGDLRDTIGQVPPSIFNKVKVWDELKKYNDDGYTKLATEMNFLTNYYGRMIQNSTLQAFDIKNAADVLPKPGDSSSEALTKLEVAQKLLRYQYGQNLPAYTLSSDAIENVAQNQVSPNGATEQFPAAGPAYSTMPLPQNQGYLDGNGSLPPIPQRKQSGWSQGLPPNPDFNLVPLQ